MRKHSPPYGERVRHHLRHPHGVGRLTAPDGVGEAGSARCGDLVHLELSLAEGRVTAARFQAYGCPAALAAASELACRLPGLTVLEAAGLGGEDVARSLELPPGKWSCSNVAADALHVALEDAVGRGADLAPPDVSEDDRGVLVGMSGGVDSSVAALALLEQGYRVVGVTFRLWSDPVCVTGRSCCSPESILEARATAHRLGLAHLTVDLSSAFYQEVVEDFIAQYRVARTPNPCVRCNATLRFSALAAVADRLRLRWIATGHYARMLGDPPRLHRGRDLHKDQSYVLAEVSPHLLRRTLFPLGEWDKQATRSRARGGGLPVHDAPESQDICFIPDDDYRRFLSERLGDAPGDIVDLQGRVLGRHRGVYRYTIGQRRGLGIAAAEPLYVVALRADEREVVVAPATEAEVCDVVVESIVRHASLPPRVAAQLRSSGDALAARVEEAVPERLVVHLERPACGIAPGQAAVLYEGDAVVVAGTIVETRSAGRAPEMVAEIPML
jgi:tRNA-specific 2-thiouridylase